MSAKKGGVDGDEMVLDSSCSNRVMNETNRRERKGRRGK
jgi:rRNA pseudouridine-1189 N-methylase Emg1 (Nep1/Mra1 family)